MRRDIYIQSITYLLNQIILSAAQMEFYANDRNNHSIYYNIAFFRSSSTQIKNNIYLNVEVDE